MIFGFLFTDILLWGVLPFIVLCLLWGDKKAWAATFTIALVLGAFLSVGFGTVVAAFTNPVTLSLILRDVVLYGIAGLAFSFLKWWVLSQKSGKQFAQWLVGQDRQKNSPLSLANAWNSSFSNTYRRVLSVAPKDSGGWKTKYMKLTLSEYVLSWAVYWPMYLVLLVLDDFIRHIIDWFVEVFGKGFQRISDSAFSRIE